jgi:hypothetical protein
MSEARVSAGGDRAVAHHGADEYVRNGVNKWRAFYALLGTMEVATLRLAVVNG